MVDSPNCRLVKCMNKKNNKNCKKKNKLFYVLYIVLSLLQSKIKMLIQKQSYALISNKVFVKKVKNVNIHMIWVYKNNLIRWISTLIKENNYLTTKKNMKITWKIGMRKNLKWLLNKKKDNLNFKNPPILFVNFLSMLWNKPNMVGSGFVQME